MLLQMLTVQILCQIVPTVFLKLELILRKRLNAKPIKVQTEYNAHFSLD